MSKSHFHNLQFYLPNLARERILDIGSGRGKFLIDAALAGAAATGLEIYPPNIELTHKKATEAGVSVDVHEGLAEHLPFESSSFDFTNLSEVIEHAEDPILVMREAYRVLKSGGHCYVSIPNRFAVLDPHFHLWFVNWMPRTWAEAYIVIRHKQKEYGLNNGRQRLSEMHYRTYTKAKRMLESVGFSVSDMRLLKLKQKGWYGYAIVPAYILARGVYFNASHFLLQK